MRHPEARCRFATSPLSRPKNLLGDEPDRRGSGRLPELNRHNLARATRRAEKYRCSFYQHEARPHGLTNVNLHEESKRMLTHNQSRAITTVVLVLFVLCMPALFAQTILTAHGPTAAYTQLQNLLCVPPENRDCSQTSFAPHS